jgi:hypothetical protein
MALRLTMSVGVPISERGRDVAGPHRQTPSVRSCAITRKDPKVAERRKNTVAGCTNAALDPGPSSESLSVRIRCWTSNSPTAATTKHMVTIGPDWTVETPHDLAAEQVAVSLGGYVSCLELQSRSIPAVQQWLALERRAAPPPLQLGSGARWHAKLRATCCPKTGFDSAGHAADHARSTRHLAVQFSAPKRHLDDLTKAIREAYATSSELTINEGLAEDAAHALTRGRRDVTNLWYAGVHPRTVTDIRDQLGVTGRLPARFYLGVLARGTDLRWMADTLGSAGMRAGHVEVVTEAAGVPLDGPANEPVVSWLAWTQAGWDKRDPTARGRWLVAGVSRSMILCLGDAGYDPDDVVALARGLGREPDGAARHLERWLAAGLHPDVADLIRLHESGRAPHWYVPSGAAVARLRRELGSKVTATDMELALTLAVAGTVPDAVAAFSSGTTLW